MNTLTLIFKGALLISFPLLMTAFLGPCGQTPRSHTGGQDEPGSQGSSDWQVSHPGSNSI